MSPIVPSLAEVFAAIPDPRHARGTRHPLVALLLLTSVAMLAGARGQAEIADWARNHGDPWRTRLGFTPPQGPRQATLHRLFAPIAVEAVEVHLAWWMQPVCAALDIPTLRASYPPLTSLEQWLRRNGWTDAAARSPT